MARPRSQGRRDAILSAAARVVASQGTGAATAAIAKEDGGPMAASAQVRGPTFGDRVVAETRALLVTVPADAESRDR